MSATDPPPVAAPPKSESNTDSGSNLQLKKMDDGSLNATDMIGYQEYLSFLVSRTSPFDKVCV
jgi:hypothetical protein